MSKSLVTLGVVLGVVLTGLNAHAADCSKTARWANDPPYSMRDPGGEIKGMHPDLLREVMKRIPCKLQFVELPWARAVVYLKDGQLDILPNALKTPERQQFAFFSIPTDSSRNVLFVTNKSAKKFDLKNLGDIIGTDFKLGVQVGAAYSEEYDELIKNPKFSEHLIRISTLQSGMKMLNAGRIDGQFADEVTGLLLLNELGLSRAIRVGSVVTSREPSFIAFSKATTDESFVRKFDEALSNMMKDGSYERILERTLLCKVSAKALGCK